jgi:hypothetical protein
MKQMFYMYKEECESVYSLIHFHTFAPVPLKFGMMAKSPLLVRLWILDSTPKSFGNPKKSFLLIA